MCSSDLAHMAEVGSVGSDAPELPEPKPAGKRSGKPAPPRKQAPGMVRIYVGAGRKANMRPADLVGAIINEAKLEAGQIGVIEITDKFSLVELPEDRVDSVITALRATTIKGKRQTVRRDQATRPR